MGFMNEPPYPRCLVKRHYQKLPLLLMGFIIVVIGVPLLVGRLPWWWLAFVSVGLLLLGNFVRGWEKRRIWKRVKECDYLVCPDCGYRLVGVASPGRCPECGTPFDEEDLRKTWRHFEYNWL
jgi:DNA-directed RNA polymerase subunit RPC12/RpoP